MVCPFAVEVDHMGINLAACCARLQAYPSSSCRIEVVHELIQGISYNEAIATSREKLKFTQVELGMTATKTGILIRYHFKTYG